ncbi:hypothetical protein WIW50_12860 [Flavobacteriaceae bacterium 3-367]|uniref:hypothetical protein n=1 Tax=Eudoraea algarum TaxID=3417568 RepID=UPI00326C9D9B
MHEYVSSDPDATLNFLGITIDKNGFPNINVYIWFLLGKVVPLYLLLIWFFTCKHWWYHIILIPILMYAFQIFEGVISEDDYIDTENILWILPFCMIVIPFVYFVRVKLYDKHVHGIDLEAMDAELKALHAKQQSGQDDKVNETVSTDSSTSIEEDLTEKTSNKALGELVKQFRTAMRSFLNL